MCFLLIIGCAGRHKPPKIELCIIGDAGLICNDPRLESDVRDYTIPIEDAKNYLCTNPDDYNTLQKWMNSKIKELEECLKSR